MVSKPLVAMEILRNIRVRGELKPEVRGEDLIYPDLLEHEDWEEVLAELVIEGYVTRKVYDRIIKCPNCASMNIRSKYTCPACKSFNLEKTRIMQHTLCGFTGSELEFKRGEELVCPKCGNKLTAFRVDYIVFGWSFECLECRKRSINPVVVHTCNLCKAQFTPQEAEYVPVYSYVLTDKGVKALEEVSFLAEAIKEELISEGYKVWSKGERPGVSGMKHHFSIVVEGERGMVGVDFHPERELTTSDLLSYMVKVYDSNVPYILVSEEAGEDVKNAGRAYGARVISGFNIENVKKVIKEVVGEGVRKVKE